MSTQSTNEFQAFKLAHKIAFADLTEYEREDQVAADRLNPIVHATNFAELKHNAPNLVRYLSCSVFVDELYDALIAMVIEYDRDGPRIV